MPDRPGDRPRQVHRQPRAGTRPVVRVRRERLLPALQAETAEDGRVDGPPVLLGHDRAEEGRDACARIPQAPAHVLLPVARMGHGRAQEGVDARKDRGATEGRMARRPAYEDQPRMPPPVDPRQAAQGVGPQAVPASRQAAPHAFEGQEGEGGRIPMRVPITDRPKKADSRHEFGRFESDTVVGASPSKRCIDTQVERKSRRLFARFIPDKGAPATARAEYDIHKDIPAPARIDRTWDNGTESSCHLLVDEALGMLTYYADPYSSHQRGSNENRNGRIRRYLPKRTSFDDLTDEDLQVIVREINDTPMKVLDWETPNEVWYRELGKIMSKTSHPKTSVALTN